MLTETVDRFDPNFNVVADPNGPADQQLGLIAAFAHRRLREKPPEGGVSVYRESIPLDSELATAGRRLLEDLNWQGVAMIECKRDANPRSVTCMSASGSRSCGSKPADTITSSGAKTRAAGRKRSWKTTP